MMELVELSGVEYAAEQCKSCNGSGVKRDLTLAENVHSRTRGKIGCPMCVGAGTRYTITERGMAQERAKWAEQQVARINKLNADLSNLRQFRADLGGLPKETS